MTDWKDVTIALILALAVLGMLSVVKDCDNTNTTLRKQFMIECVKHNSPLECRVAWRVQL